MKQIINNVLQRELELNKDLNAITLRFNSKILKIL